MNRKEIKEEAKAKVKGNKWNILWPMLVIGVVTTIITRIFGIGTVQVSSTMDMENLFQNYQFSTGQPVGLLITSLASGILYAGYYKYILNFVRTGSFNSSDILNTIKEKG